MEQGVNKPVIDGVIVHPLKKIADERGMVMHMIRADSPYFEKFGEIYFSTVKPGIVKAWKRHFKMTQHFAVPVGKIRLVIYDDRKDSSSSGKIDVLEIGEDNYCLVKIPPLLWYGFQGISIMPAIIANCTDLTYEPHEVERLNPTNNNIPFDWLSPLNS